MKTFAIGLSAAALMIGGTAFAAAAGTQATTGARRSADTDGNGVVTRAEAQAKAAARFARLDVNKDGKIDQTDREARREAMKTRRFAQLDTNNDGNVSKAEFMADRGPSASRRMAMGKPGKRDHMRRGGRHGGGMKGMRMADADKNGTISQAEFSTAALKRFDAMDANKDGQVTREERQAAREQMKARWQQMRAQKAQG